MTHDKYLGPRVVLEIGKFQMRVGGKQLALFVTANILLPRLKFADVTSLRNNCEFAIFPRRVSRMDRVDLLFDFLA